MPSSRPNTIPTIVHLIRQLRPQSILDVGVGFGKWGHLFREYTDILEAENDPARYHRKNWKVRIDGIEGYAAYLTEMHRYLYNEIFIGNACAILRTLGSYDVIFMGDIIEHLDKETGRQLLRDARAKANKAVIVSTPKHETHQPDLCGNELERHRSLWTTKDFRQFDRAIVKTIDRATLIAVLLKPGVATPECGPPRQPAPADVHRFNEAKCELIKHIALDEPFILVDEEQVRSLLPHKRAIPFLEKDGQYWGPPADSKTAVAEVERLRGAGARYIAFIWSTAWWLDHYADFAHDLRSRFRRVAETGAVTVFAFDEAGAARPN
jgi:hypothetical protein